MYHDSENEINDLIGFDLIVKDTATPSSHTLFFDNCQLRYFCYRQQSTRNRSIHTVNELRRSNQKKRHFGFKSKLIVISVIKIMIYKQSYDYFVYI